MGKTTEETTKNRDAMQFVMKSGKTLSVVVKGTNPLKYMEAMKLKKTMTFTDIHDVFYVINSKDVDAIKFLGYNT